MMKLPSKIIIITLALILLVVAFFFLPKHGCCDEFDSEYENLIRKGFSGDVNSLRKLYEKSIQDGVESNQETWSRLGALAGDPFFRKIYLDIVINKKGLERQKKILEDIKEDQYKYPGAVTLLKELQLKMDGLKIEVQNLPTP